MSGSDSYTESVAPDYVVMVKWVIEGISLPVVAIIGLVGKKLLDD